MFQNPESRKCLLAITGAFDFNGGIAAVNRLIIHTLSDAGYDLWLFALNETHTSGQKYAQFPHMHYLGMDNNKIRFTSAVWQSILTQRYNLIFFDHVNLASMVRPLAILRLIRYSVFIHGMEVFPPAPTFEGRMGLRGAERRLVNSKCTGQSIQDQFPHLTVTECDLALSPVQSAFTDIVKSSSDKLYLTAVNGTVYQLSDQVILHVGRMAAGDQYKGQDTLLKAMPRILSKYPQAQLVLVGGGDDTKRLKDLACAQLPHVQSAIFMPGHVSDDILSRLYQACYLFAMPSWGEGFGLVYIEAMRWGKPCIGSRVDAARCIIQDGETGFLVGNPRDFEETAEKIVLLLNTPDRARVMGQAGYQRVRDFYLFPHFKARFLKGVGLSQ